MADLKTLLGDAYKESMTLDEINEALETVSVVDEKRLDGLVPKSLLDKTCSEAADYKRRLREAMSEQERLAAEDKDYKESLEMKVQQLEQENKITKFRGEYLGMGYSEESASKIATAMADGDTETVFALTKQHQEGIKKTVEAELMKNMGTPPAGNGSQTVDYNKKQVAALEAGNAQGAILAALEEAQAK